MNPVSKIDTDRRNEHGLPEVPAQAKNVCQIAGNQQPVDANVKQIYGVNLQLPWFVILALAAGAALALTIEDRLGRQQELEWAMRTAKAETEAKLSPVISKLQTDIARATQDAAVAKDWTDQKNTELKTLRKANER